MPHECIQILIYFSFLKLTLIFLESLIDIILPGDASKYISANQALYLQDILDVLSLFLTSFFLTFLLLKIAFG